MVTKVRATTLEEVVEAVRSYPSVRVSASGSQAAWRLEGEQVALALDVALSGVVEYDVADQVVVVRPGTTIEELNASLAEEGYCLPFLPLSDFLMQNATASGTVGGHLSLNQPHVFEADHGSWRDWILGLTIVRGDGEIAKMGSKAVKSVAGYDVMKLFVGARGALGVLVEVILRVTPIRARAMPDFVLGPVPASPSAGVVQRVRASDYGSAVSAGERSLVASCPKTSTLIHSLTPTEEPARFPGDWVMAWGRGPQNFQIEDDQLVRLMKRTKECLDPLRKFNPGEFGIL